MIISSPYFERVTEVFVIIFSKSAFDSEKGFGRLGVELRREVAAAKG